MARILFIIGAAMLASTVWRTLGFHAWWGLGLFAYAFLIGSINQQWANSEDKK